jgi:hypothetical protein
MFLDKWQYTLGEMEGKMYGDTGQGIPVLTFEELSGLMLGYNPWDIGLQMHQINVEPLLDKIGIPYSTKLKYCDKNGNSLGMPVSTTKMKLVQTV